MVPKRGPQVLNLLFSVSPVAKKQQQQQQFDAWFEQITDCMEMAGNMPREQRAAMLRMTMGPSVRDLIKILPPDQRSDPEILIAFLRETARPNRDAVAESTHC